MGRNDIEEEYEVKDLPGRTEENQNYPVGIAGIPVEIQNG
jgi:hypothetical protein